MFTVTYQGTDYACKGAQEVARLYNDLGIDKAQVSGQVASIRMTSSVMTKADVSEWVRMNEE